MSYNISDGAILSNGVKMPWLGLGVFRIKDGEEVKALVKAALKTGYKSVDTAACYGNETGIGKAIKESDVDRKVLFITSKVWNTNQGYEETLRAFEESRKRLSLEYLDLYLIHWPVNGKYKETWRAMEKLYQEGLVRAIGVSNFQIHHIEDLLSSASITPMINQVELHPLLTNKPLHSFCSTYNIQLEAWSPLMQGNLNVPLLMDIAKKYLKSPAQVILRWDLQNQVIAIPKTGNLMRLSENLNIFDFELTKEDMENIDNLNHNKRFGQDPDNFNFDFLNK